MTDTRRSLASASELVREARERGVSLWIEGTRVRYRAPGGGLPVDLRERIAPLRTEIADVLRREAEKDVRLEPVGPNQVGIWHIQQLVPNTTAYNIGVAYAVSGGVEWGVLSESVQVLVDRHDVLRTDYPEIDGEPVRRVVGHRPIQVIRSVLPDDEPVADGLRGLTASAFRLDEGPPFRVHRVQTSEGDVVLLLAHHLVLDGLSIRMLARELMTVYQALQRGVTPPRSRSESGAYREWVESQLARLARSGTEASRFWAGVLDPPPVPLSLPLDRPRPAESQIRGATRTFRCGTDLSERLRSVCRERGHSPFTGLLAAYAAFLRALSGHDDITVGTPVHGRSSARFAATLGYLVNVVPVRLRDVGEPSFLGLMDQVREIFRVAGPYQDYPLPRITWDHSQAHRGQGPPVRTLFALHDFRRFSELKEDLDAPASVTRELHFDQLEGQFDLALEVFYEDERFLCCWRFDPSVLDGPTVDTWATVFGRLLEDVLDRLEAPLRDIPPRAERSQPPLSGRQLTLEDRSVCASLVAYAVASPGRTAVEAPDGTYTYSELHSAAGAVTAALRELGIGPGDFVGVALGRSRELVAGLIGVQGTGAAYVPLDPTHPPARLLDMLNDAQVVALVTHRGLADAWGVAPRILDLDVIDWSIVGDFEPSPPEAAAYATFTSGSTGTPKAVVVPHGAVMNLMGSMAVEPGMSESDVLLAVTTVSFDISVLELFLPLIVGARVVIASEDEVHDGEELARHLSQAGVTVMQATPATWKLLLGTGWTGKDDLRAFCGGEPLPRGLADDLSGRVAELWNMYGPTETTVWSTVHRIQPGEPVLIGSPIANTTAHVLDPSMRYLPVGFAGEIYLGGAGVATGYLSRPNLTAERFVEDPTSTGTRLYRTGDLARQRHDGTLEHLGRVDDQVKVRGFRIELGEVEAALRSHDAVHDAVVTARKDHGGDVVLAAWIVPGGAAGHALDDVVAHLRRILPSYMLPTSWAVIDEIPLTRNGKVDRRALPSLQRTGSTGIGSDAPSRASGLPRNAEEEVLVEIWQEVLGRRSIGILEDFFELGGHSLLATMITARVRSVLGVELPLRQLFAEPTISGQARWIRSAQTPAVMRPQISRREVSVAAPLSFSQERMWFLQHLSPEDTSYNLAIATIVDGVFDRTRLLAALTALEERHSVLTSRIVTSRGRPQQVVGPPGGFEVVQEDLTHLPPDEALDGGLALVTEHLYRPYDLGREPPLRLVLAKLAEDRNLLGVGLHHVVGDQGSFEILIRELSELYFRGPRSANLPPLPIDYRDFAAWQRDLLSGEALADSLAYWREQLADLPPLELPTDQPRPRIRRHEGDRVTTPIPVSTMEALSDLSVETRATPFMLLLAVYAVFLYSRSRQSDLPIGVPTAHRDHQNLEGLIGSFVNTLVYRVDLTGDPSFREVVARVRETALAAFAHQDLPFEFLVRDLNPPRDESRTPLFQVMFNLANVSVGEGGFPGLEAESVRLPYPAAQVDLTMTAEINERRQEYQLNYSTHLFERETAEAMVRQYAETVERALADPDAHLAELASAPSGERWLLLEEWNRTERETDPWAPLPQVLTERAMEHGDRTAVDGPSGSWSYRELAGAAAGVTERLRSVGVREGDRVAVMMGRDRELLAVLIGVWGTGAAYVPLDPTYPAARLQMMLEDSGAVVVVSHRGLADKLGSSVPVLDVDSGPSPPGTARFASLSRTHTAYVIYTSGSTGTPKGVEVPHRAVVNLLQSMADEPGLTESDVLLAVTTISFDISVLELFLPLFVGARVVIATEEDSRDGRRLAARLDESRATVMQATPSTWRLMVTAGWEGSTDFRAFCGGEALSPDLANDLLARSAELWNMYGPTETTVWSSVQRIEALEPILIGSPIANTLFYVLDSALMPVPIGVPGELYIGGEGIATGYFGRPRLTAERFVENPFRAGETIYRTGDLVRYRRDGKLEHLGRLDHQVKVRGHRVELGDVEARLLAHPGVEDAVVVAWQERLVAHIRNERVAAPTTAELRTWMSTALPAYMVPSLFVPLDNFPLTPNGKVDRARLPDPTRGAAHAPANVATSGPTEKAIADVWRGLLGIVEVGANDNFFELGGHSLLAMEAVALLEERAGIRLDPREMFFKSLRQLGGAGGGP